MRSTLAIATVAFLALGGLAACGDDSEEGAAADDGAESTDSTEEEQPATGSDPVPDAPIPDDVTLTRQDATLITWGEIEDTFDYEVKVDGELLGTSFETSYTALGAVDGEVTVEALDSEPAPDVQTEAVEVLVIEWTEEPGANYYVQYTDIDGTLATTASSPFILDGPPEEVEAVRFGPAMLVSDDETTSYEPPFDFEEQYYVELPLP